jgi:PAS domain S-box-containing protein/putative nucleotidyltransferase with HDIG domain
VSRSGWRIIAEVTERPIKFGAAKAILSVAHDITERKRADEALREKEETIRALVETSQDWIWSIDLKGIHIYSNPAVEKILGYTPVDLIGKSSLTLLHNEDREVIQTKLPQWIKEKKGWQNLILRWRHKDGRWRWLESNAVPMFDGQGKVIGFRGVDRDITERKKAEEKLQHSYQQMKNMLVTTVNALASTVEMKDQYTAGHQPRVTQLACAIAEEMDLPEKQIEGIRMAGLIHDIGKIMVPAEILNKPGPLTEIQYEMVKMHPQAGYDILEGIKFPWPVAEIVLQHHELMDGSGYPEGLSGNEILLEARILTVANVVEAMISHRPYRAAHDIKEALAEISKNKKVLYDPHVVDACQKLFAEKRFAFEQVQ